MTHKTLGLLIGGLTLALSASPALAANVTVEVEGQTLQTAPVAATTAASVTKGGYTCSTANSVLSALDAATAGDWDGVTYGPGAPERIRTESHPFGPGASSWAFYVNGRFVNGDACSTSLADGDRVLWFWSNAFASEGYEEPVLLDAPTTATPGQPITVTVRQADTTFDSVTFAGTTALAPAAGATVTGGAAAATTDGDGRATVTLPGGPYTLVATKGNRAPSRIAGCATNGHDGFCGTTADPVATPQVTTNNSASCTACVASPRGAFASSLAEGKKFKKGAGPRELAGRVDGDATKIADVRLRLTGNDRGRCVTYDAKKEQLSRLKRCGAKRGRWFSIGAKEDFRYLLPARLGRGRWVLDLQVVDPAGQRTTLARGTSRVVFTVA